MVHRFHASEATCAATSLSLRLLCVTTRADIPPWQFLGQPLQLQVVTDSGRLRAFNALIVRAQPGQFDGSLQTWLIEAVDACTFMGAGRNSRIYLRKNVIEITEQLLGEWRAHSPVLAGCFDFDTRQLTPDRYPQREMSIQWNESDPAFLMRLWRKHGIAWGVRAEAETSPTDPPRHTLVLVDDSAQLPANPAGRLRCHTGTAVREHDDITLWSPVGRVVPSLVERAAWSYTQQQPLRADTRSMAHLGEQGDALARALTDVRIEPPHWADGNTHHQQLTLLRMQHHEMNATGVSGASTARDLACLTWAAIDEIPGELPLTRPSGAASNEFLFTRLATGAATTFPKTSPTPSTASSPPAAGS
jgi:type VI secretion system secreted protein VgrG